MQSRLATALSTKSYWVFPLARNQVIQRGGFAAATTTGTTADPAIHSKDRDEDPAFPSPEPEGIQDVAKPKSVKQENIEERKASAEKGPFVSPKPPHPSSPRLENPGISQSSQPNTQQKRSNTTSAHKPTAALEEVSCVGIDGWPEEDKNKEKERWQDRDEQEEDDKQYFKHHKASPLSEMEMADTRKPITQATDGTATGGYFGGDRNVIGWMPEQLDTAEEALRRAAEIFKQNAMRGDPHSPHGRVLRARLGEDF